MSGAAVEHTASAAINHAVEQGHKGIAISQFQQQLVDIAQHGLRRRLATNLGTQQTARKSHIKGSRQTFVGNIGDRHTKMVRIQADYVIKISTHLTGGRIAGAKVKARDVRETARQHTLLDLASQLQLAFQALLAGQLGLSLLQLVDFAAQIIDQAGALEFPGQPAEPGSTRVKPPLVKRRICAWCEPG